jgi:hypothetical protein
MMQKKKNKINVKWFRLVETGLLTARPRFFIFYELS